MNQSSVRLDKVCLLDPKAELALTPADGDGVFEWFLFGVRTFLVCTERICDADF